MWGQQHCYNMLCLLNAVTEYKLCNINRAAINNEMFEPSELLVPGGQRNSGIQE